MKGKVGMSNSHVVEEGIDFQKLLNVLVQIFGVGPESLLLRVESFRKILHGVIAV